jgi:hypothetical protein
LASGQSPGDVAYLRAEIARLQAKLKDPACLSPYVLKCQLRRLRSDLQVAIAVAALSSEVVP